MDRNDQKNQEQIAGVEVTKSPFDTFGVAIFLVVLVQVIVLVGLNLYQKSRTEALSQQLDEHRATLASPNYATLNTQLEEVLEGQDILRTVLASKVKWSEFYAQLSNVTPKNVKVNTLQLNTNGTFRADGETPSMASLAQLLVAWQKGTDTASTPFTSVVLSSNGFSNDEGNRIVTFSIAGTINTARLR